MNSRCLENECYNTVLRLKNKSTGYCQDHQRPSDYWERINAGLGRRKPPPGWGKIRSQIIKRDQGRCVKCGHKGANHVDHIKPLWDGGTNLLTNLQLLCWLCHEEKTEEEKKLKTRKKFTPKLRGKKS